MFTDFKIGVDFDEYHHRGDQIPVYNVESFQNEPAISLDEPLARPNVWTDYLRSLRNGRHEKNVQYLTAFTMKVNHAVVFEKNGASFSSITEPGTRTTVAHLTRREYWPTTIGFLMAWKPPATADELCFKYYRQIIESRPTSVTNSAGEGPDVMRDPWLDRRGTSPTTPTAGDAPVSSSRVNVRVQTAANHSTEVEHLIKEKHDLELRLAEVARDRDALRAAVQERDNVLDKVASASNTLPRILGHQDAESSCAEGH